MRTPKKNSAAVTKSRCRGRPYSAAFGSTLVIQISSELAFLGQISRDFGYVFLFT